MDILINAVGGEDLAANKLKEAGTKHWTQFFENVTNSSGFTAVPAGKREGGEKCSFSTSADEGFFWSFPSKERNEIGLFQMGEYFQQQSVDKDNGLSIRLVKDE